MGLFSSKKPSLLGIDISPSAIKLLELSQQRGGRYRMEHYAAEALPTGTIHENHITDIHSVGLGIQRALKQSGSKTKQAVVAVSGANTISKIIQMPQGLSERELESMIEMEAEQHIPFALKEVGLDFAVLGPSHVADKIDVLLAAARSDDINARVKALEIAGLQAEAVELDSLAVERACHQLLPQTTHQSIAILDIGAHSAVLYVIRQGQLIYSREQDFGGQQLTDEISQRYGLTPSEAEQAKCQGHLPEDYPFQVLEPFKHSMAQQTSRAIQFYHSTTSNNYIDSLVLAGGCISLPGTVEAIQEQITVPVSTINPFQGIKTRRKIKLARIQRNASAMLVAYGLALRNFS